MTTPHDHGFDGGLTCALECADLDRSLAWYSQVLGFETLSRVDELSWAEMKTPVEGVSLGLGQAESPQVLGGATLTWGVTDIDRARAKLESLDVRFDGETMTIPDMVRLATFFDPDGHKHMLYQDLSQGDGAS